MQSITPPRYWDIDTEATYPAGSSIVICIRYDQSWVGDECVTGPPMEAECNVKIIHYDSAGTLNVLPDPPLPFVALDTEANIVCGVTTSLSPFTLAVPLPLSVPVVTVPGSVIVDAGTPAGAAVSYLATAHDEEDGPLVPICSPPSGSTFPIGTTQVKCRATDSHGLSGESIFPVTVRPPGGLTFSNVPGVIKAFATSTSGAKVSYTKPIATDSIDGPRPVTCSPISGSRFPVGKTKVTCVAFNRRGQKGTATFTVWVQYQAPQDGTFFLAPIRPDGNSIFLVGRPVPVKFKLTGASAGITDLVAKLIVTRVSDRIGGSVDCESDEDGDETDFLFRYRRTKGIYAYRWKTRGESSGTYRLRADLGDDVLHEVTVSLRRAGR